MYSRSSVGEGEVQDWTHNQNYAYNNVTRGGWYSRRTDVCLCQVQQ